MEFQRDTILLFPDRNSCQMIDFVCSFDSIVGGGLCAVWGLVERVFGIDHQRLRLQWTKPTVWTSAVAGGAFFLIQFLNIAGLVRFLVHHGHIFAERIFVMCSALFCRRVSRLFCRV